MIMVPIISVWKVVDEVNVKTHALLDKLKCGKFANLLLKERLGS